MNGSYSRVDAFGRDIGIRPEDVVPYDPSRSEIHHRYMDGHYDDSRSPSRRRCSSRSRSRSPYRRYHRHSWEVPTNPLSRRDDSDPEMEERRHHRHHHRHHHHHRHGSSRSSSRSRSRSHHHQTEADKKERWGHELYIEKVILNPEPEPPRIITEIEAPQEKWISKAGGVAIFTNRPTSASSYQGRRDY